MGTIQLWRDKKAKEARELDPALFFQKAEQLAKDIDMEGRDNQGRDKWNKSTQLRRFYDELFRLNSQAQAKKDEWGMIKPRVHMIVAKAAYAKGRELVTDTFVALIRDGISQVDTREDLQVFTNFFESFMGFYKALRKN
jgi:CRISPR-associated protein Csm2